jgi:hypothetical protein
MSETPTTDPTPDAPAPAPEQSLDPAPSPSDQRPERRPQSPWRGHGPRPWSNLSPTR